MKRRKLIYLRDRIDWYIQTGETGVLSEKSIIPKSSYVVIGKEVYEYPTEEELCRTLKIKTI